MSKIKEAIKTNNGKLIYVIEMQQQGNRIQLYINSQNKIHFQSDSYCFDKYATFDINQEAHRVAKEIFLTYLQAYVKSKLLELKQLELVLDELGLKNVIRKTIVDNSSMLLETKEDIIQESIEYTESLIKLNNKKQNKIAKQQAENIINETVRPIARKKKIKD